MENGKCVGNLADGKWEMENGGYVLRIIGGWSKKELYNCVFGFRFGKWDFERIVMLCDGCFRFVRDIDQSQAFWRFWRY